MNLTQYHLCKAFALLAFYILSANQLTYGLAEAIVKKGGTLIDCSFSRIVDERAANSLAPVCKFGNLGTYLKVISELTNKGAVRQLDFSANSIRLEGATQVLNKVEEWKKKEFKNLEKLDLSRNKLYENNFFLRKLKRSMKRLLVYYGQRFLSTSVAMLLLRKDGQAIFLRPQGY